jgi:uncharacterized protein (TIGR00159 family)
MNFFDSLIPFFEILVIAIILYYLLSFFWRTRSMDLMIGALAFLMIFGITSYLNLPILYTIMQHVANVAAVAVIVVFQPELRLALSKLSFKGNQYKMASDKFLDQLTSSVFRLADKRRGALIVIEHKHGLDEFARQGVSLNADFSPELLESIFAYATPLHDGAVLIRNKTILAATVILPLAESSAHLSKDMGTRHLAALGFSQITDSFVITVSEETGKVSIFHKGEFAKNLKEDRFKALFRTVFTPHEQASPKNKFNLWEWLKT